MKSSTIAKTFTIAAVAALTLCMAPAANANDKGCSTANLQGTFAYTSTGSIAAPPELAGPFVEVGTQTFDGKGATTATASSSQNGNISPLSVVGTYTVNADCTGTMTLQVSFPGFPVFPVHVYFVIANGWTEFQAIETDPGLVITRLGRKLYPGRNI